MNLPAGLDLANESHGVLPAQPWEDLDRILRHGEKARAGNDAARAHTFFARAVELNPNDPRGWIGLAQTAATPDESIISWGYTLALVPDDLDARVELDTQIETRIQASDIADTAVLIALGRTLAEVGNKPAAHRLLERATILAPLNVEGWIWRAGVAADPTETIRCLKYALALDPQNAQARAGLKWATEQQTSEPTITPEATHQAATLCAEGKQVLARGDTASAYELFRRATELDPQNQAAWFWRSHAAPNTAEALTCITRTLELNPLHPEAKEMQWWLRIKQLREQSHAQPTPIYLPAEEPFESEEPATSTRRFAVLPIVTLLVIAMLVIAVVIFVRLAR